MDDHTSLLLQPQHDLDPFFDGRHDLVIHALIRFEKPLS